MLENKDVTCRSGRFITITILMPWKQAKSATLSDVIKKRH
jgi:hypothetical protein